MVFCGNLSWLRNRNSCVLAWHILCNSWGHMTVSPTSNYTVLTSVHILEYTLTLTQGSWHEYSLSKEQRINTRETLSSANTDIVMPEMASEVEGFPPGIVYFVNEWVAHNGVADKLKRYKDKSFRRNKKWLTGTHQQMVNHFRLWGWAVAHEIVFQKGWKGDGKEREKERAGGRKTTNVLIGSGKGAWF